MTPKEARQLLIKIGRSKKYKITPGSGNFNFYKFLDTVYAYITKSKIETNPYIGSPTNVIDFFFKGTYMGREANVYSCVLKTGKGVDMSLRRGEITFAQVLNEIEAL